MAIDPEAFRRTLGVLGVELPVRPDPTEGAVLVDASGSDFMVVDLNAERPTDDVDVIARLIADAINAAGRIEGVS